MYIATSTWAYDCRSDTSCATCDSPYTSCEACSTDPGTYMMVFTSGATTCLPPTDGHSQVDDDFKCCVSGLDGKCPDYSLFNIEKVVCEACDTTCHKCTESFNPNMCKGCASLLHYLDITMDQFTKIQYVGPCLSACNYITEMVLCLPSCPVEYKIAEPYCRSPKDYSINTSPLLVISIIASFIAILY